MLFDHDDFAKNFDRNFNRMAGVAIVTTVMGAIGGLGLVGVVIYVLIKWAGTF